MSGDASKPAIQGLRPGHRTDHLDRRRRLHPRGDQRVARSATTFYWAAFKANANMKVGYYTGNGTADGNTQSITGLGFSPDFLIVIALDAARALQACSATPAGRSYEFDIGVKFTNQITALGADGFTVRHTPHGVRERERRRVPLRGVGTTPRVREGGLVSRQLHRHACDHRIGSGRSSSSSSSSTTSTHPPTRARPGTSVAPPCPSKLLDYAGRGRQPPRGPPARRLPDRTSPDREPHLRRLQPRRTGL